MSSANPQKKQPVPFGNYLLLDRVNIGGMAEVWRGKHFGTSGFERVVAIKRILPNIAEDAEFIQMFIDEAKITVHLTHANIAQIYELNCVNNSYFIAMEYIAGKDMRAIFDRCRKNGEAPPVPLTCYLISKACEGLDYAHRKKDQTGRDLNIVHRDISPQNILISYDGEIKVIDFGIAKAANKISRTQAGILKGKFGYMSPEQIRGVPIDRRSDIFAIGICLYEMLTGERLFIGETDFAILEKVRKAEVVAPSTYNRRIPEALDKIVLKALARETAARYQYASELADDLQRFLITSDAIFSRKDLAQYMKSTFAEEVEREKARLQEFAEIKAPAGWPPAVPSIQPLPAPPVRAVTPAIPQVAKVAVNRAVQPTAAAPSQKLSSAPAAAPITPGNVAKLTAAGSLLTNDGDESTIIADGGAPLPLPQLLREALPQSPPTVQERGRISSPSLAIPVEPPSRARSQLAAKWVVSGAAALAVLLVLVVVLLVRRDRTGYLLIEVPPELVGKAQIYVGGKNLGVARGPVLQELPVGLTALMVTADGYKGLTQTVKIDKSDDRPTLVQVKLERQVAVSRLVVLTDPAHAEVRLDGALVKGAEAGSVYVGEVPLKKQVKLHVSAPGFEAREQVVVAEDLSVPLSVSVSLAPSPFRVKVSSEPPGAQVMVAGKAVGSTPSEILLQVGVREIALSKRCFETATLSVAAPSTPGAVLPVSASLRRLPKCR